MVTSAGKPRALVLAPFSRVSLERLKDVAEVTYESWLDTRAIQDPEALGRRLADENASLLIIESDFVFEETLHLAPCLRFIGLCRGSLHHHIDIEAATRAGVLVVNTPGRNAQAVAEHAMALMFALARRVPQSDRYVKGGEWRDPAGAYASLRGVELAGATLGIIGLGAIGKRLATMALAIGMRTVAHDPYVKDAPGNVELLSLDEVLKRADFISIHVPGTPPTEGLIDDRRLALMKPTAYLVNLSDAGVVSLWGLVEALRGNRIAGAAMDVFETHPIAPDSPLLSLDNVVLTPHIGGATGETIERHSEMVVSDIVRFLAGKRPVNLVNPEVWKRL